MHHGLHGATIVRIVLIVFLNGSLGVGKTSVGEYLLWCDPESVLLEGDALCKTNPFDAYDPVRINTLIDIIHFMVTKYQSNGFRRFIVDCIFEQATEISRMNTILQKIDPEIYHFLLLSSSSQREANIKKRNRENFVWEIERSNELQNLLYTEFRNSSLVNSIEINSLKVGEVGDMILQTIEQKRSLT